MKSIGILGGMGPEATAEFYFRIIKIFQQKYGCVNDYDYPDMYIYNLPLPEIVKSVDKEKINEALQKGINKLQDIGSDFIVCPCNSASSFFSFLDIKIPVLDIFDETTKLVESKTGILGTKQTISSKSFQKRLKNFEIPTNEEQEEMTNIIMNILAGKKLESDKNKIKRIIQRFKEKNCDSVILGCTDLPLILSQKDTELEVFDTIQILANAAVIYSKSEG